MSDESEAVEYVLAMAQEDPVSDTCTCTGCSVRRALPEIQRALRTQAAVDWVDARPRVWLQRPRMHPRTGKCSWQAIGPRADGGWLGGATLSDAIASLRAKLESTQTEEG